MKRVTLQDAPAEYSLEQATIWLEAYNQGFEVGVEVERDDCARMADHYFDYAPSKQMRVAYGNIADAIRERDHDNL
jgi:hypothetical protein